MRTRADEFQALDEMSDFELEHKKKYGDLNDGVNAGPDTPFVRTRMVREDSNAISMATTSDDALSDSEVVQYRLYKRRWIGVVALVRHAGFGYPLTFTILA